MESPAAICLLLINNLSPMSDVSIRYILKNCNSEIYIGYRSPQDIQTISAHERLNFINLRDLSSFKLSVEDASYFDYTTDNFYRIVSLKWLLIEEVMKRSAAQFVVYSDLDVLWLDDVVNYVENAFTLHKNKDVIVQDGSDDLSNPALCMGIFALKNSEFGRNLLTNCYSMHTLKQIHTEQIGDDSIITDFYSTAQNSDHFLLFPQKTFPVGNLVGAFNRNGIYPGLYLKNPYIFHANYVVGLRRKFLLMYAFASEIGEIQEFELNFFQRFGFFVELKLRKFKTEFKLLKSRFTSVKSGEK